MFERKLNNDGSTNTKYVDLLDEDKPIAQQKFVCVSFVSPEKILKSKEMFYFEEFVKGWDLAKSIEKYAQFTSFIAYKYNLDQQCLQDDLSEFCKEEITSIRQESMSDSFKTFLDKHEERLEQEYASANNFQTCTRGIKVRGVYPSQKEAELRAKMLREVDPNFDVFVGPVGLWMPWDPEAYKTGRVEYLEEELNELMNKKNEHENKAKDYFNQRVKESKTKAIEENKRKALESGNKLTQNITPEGHLVGIKNMNTHETLLGSKEEVTIKDVHDTLFSGENVVTSQTDHGLSQLTNQVCK